MKSSLEQNFEKAESKKNKKKGSFQLRLPRAPKHVPRIASILGIGVGLIISLYVSIYIHRTQILEVRIEKVNALALQRAEIIATDVANWLKETERQVLLYARRPTFAAAIVMEEQEKIDATITDLKKAFSDVVGAQLILKGKAELNQEAVPPIRFTEMDMIKRAESRKEVRPEISKYGSDWIIRYVQPVPPSVDQDVIATVIFSIKLDSLVSNALEKQISLGQVELTQQFGNKKGLSVFKNGKGSIGSIQTAKVPNSHWKVNFQASYYLYEQTKINPLTVYGLMVALAAVIMALTLYIARVIGGVVEKRMKLNAAADDAEGKSSAGKQDLASPMYQKADILDVSIAEEDEDLLGLEEVAQTGSHKAVTEEMVEEAVEIQDDPSVPDVIFRAYDIRGLAQEQITQELAVKIGQALGSEAIDHGQEALIVARDARLSSPALTEYLIRGILSTGCNVLNIGTVPTPLLYFATNTLKESQSGIMVTASHNPKEFNGFKVVMNGKIRSDDDIKAIRRRILKNDVYSGEAEEKKHDIVPEYIDTIFSDVALAGDVTVVIDAGHGVTGKVAPRLFEELGCNVIPMLCDLDGNFPQHDPDPSVEKNLRGLVEKVKETNADIGVAFDGDGDRLVVVTPSGEIIWPDQLLMMFAKDIVSRNPGADVVFDVKSTRQLSSAITSYGGRPIMWKTGHAPMKNKMLESGALLGGEYSGHIFIKDRWFGFDDGMYAAARLIEILSLQGETLDEMFAEFPKLPCTPEIRVPVPEENKFEIVEQLADIGNFGEGRVTKIDGVRVDYSYGWGLVRASNTSANLTLRFEADDEDGLHKVKSTIAKELRVVAPQIKINWEA